MISVKELREFLDGIHDDTHVAIDEGGLTLILCTSEGVETGSSIEVGGVPADEDTP